MTRSLRRTPPAYFVMGALMHLSISSASVNADFGRRPMVRVCPPSQVDVEAIYRAGVYSWDHTSPRMVSCTMTVDAEHLICLLHILSVV